MRLKNISKKLYLCNHDVYNISVNIECYDALDRSNISIVNGFNRSETDPPGNDGCVRVITWSRFSM